MALSLEGKNFPVCHYRRNEHLNGLRCSGVYGPLASLVIMKECTSYKVHHVNIMMSIDGDADDDDDGNGNDRKIYIAIHLRIMIIKSINF